jgi:hypothetical protein
VPLSAAVVTGVVVDCDVGGAVVVCEVVGAVVVEWDEPPPPMPLQPAKTNRDARTRRVALVMGRPSSSEASEQRPAQA